MRLTVTDGGGGAGGGGVRMTPEEKAAATQTLVNAWVRGNKPDRFTRTAQLVKISVRDGGARCAYCKLNLDR